MILRTIACSIPQRRDVREHRGMNILCSDDTNATYENFTAVCPLCRATNIFNRASDLKTFKPIGFRTVSCQVSRVYHCFQGQSFILEFLPGPCQYA